MRQGKLSSSKTNSLTPFFSNHLSDQVQNVYNIFQNQRSLTLLSTKIGDVAIENVWLAFSDLLGGRETNMAAFHSILYKMCRFWCFLGFKMIVQYNLLLQLCRKVSFLLSLAVLVAKITSKRKIEQLCMRQVMLFSSKTNSLTPFFQIIHPIKYKMSTTNFKTN